MSTLSKVFVLITFVLTVVYVTVSATLFANRKNWKLDSLANLEKFEEVTKAKEGLNAEFGNYKGHKEKQLTDLKNKASIARTKTESVTADLERTKVERDNAQEAAQRVLNELSKISDQLKQQRETQKDTMDRLTEAEEERDILKQDKEELRDQKVQLEAEKLDLTKALGRETDFARDLSEELKEKSQILAIVKRDFLGGVDLPALLKRSAPLPANPIRGKVIGIDSELGLVIISVGRDEQVKERYSFIIYRGSNYVAKATVDQVFDDMSACTVITEFKAKEPQIGDEVTTRLLFQGGP